MDNRSLMEIYRERSEFYLTLADKEKRILFILSLMRLLIFAGGIILTWIGFSHSTVPGILSLFFFMTLFMVLLRRYSIHSDRHRHFSNMQKINLMEMKAVSGDVSSFPDGDEFRDISHDFSYDTDLFGKDSLFQFLNRTSTALGAEILAGWLTDQFSLARNLENRQKAISDLASRLEWRQDFMAMSMGKNLDKEHIAGILGWLGEEHFPLSPRMINILIILLPASCIISAFLLAAGLVHYTLFTSIFLINLSVSFSILRKTNAFHLSLSGRSRFLFSMGDLILHIDKEPFEADHLNEIRNAAKEESISAAGSLKKLGRIIQAFDSRLNIIVGFFLNGTILWDLHCIRKLEKWKSAHGSRFVKWLELTGQIDAFLSLGNYAFNNNDYSFPVISADSFILSADALGHPLIDPVKRVCNSFSIRQQDICIISGANMAGKSTFLRTVAVNYILAMTGAPVCAKTMSFRPARLFTSMRTTDSLTSGESYFYAELKRLVNLLTRIRENHDVFFILDEILKGTNSEDKTLGSKMFIRRLIETGGTGLIATHDTSLGRMKDEFPGIIVNKCIEIEIDGDIIKFDYQLRDGITKSRNAVLLMRNMGITD